MSREPSPLGSDARTPGQDFEFEAMEEARNYRAALVREFGPYLDGSVAEVGAGIGQISTLIRALPKVKDLWAIEPEAAFQERLAARVGAERVVRGTLADLPAEVEPDAILSVNVLEHVRDDAAELGRFAARLRPRGGRLCLFVPARPEIYSLMDRDLGHFRRYTRKGLRRLLEGAGFDFKVLKYFNMVGYLAWWWRFKVRAVRRFDGSEVRLFDRVIFPVTYRAETWVTKPPFGQSLLAVAQVRQIDGRCPRGA